MLESKAAGLLLEDALPLVLKGSFSSITEGAPPPPAPKSQTKDTVTLNLVLQQKRG